MECTLNLSAMLRSVNRISNTGTQKKIFDLFETNSYIRLNGYFISPFSLISIRRGLRTKLDSWEFQLLQLF